MHINATKPGDERAREDMQVEETTPSTPLRPTRAGFVRGLPLTMPVEEVIERGREVGIELQPSDIHAARYYMRQAAAAESSSIPQQLMLGGTFVTKREPRAANGAAKKNGASTASINGASTASTNGASTNGHSHASAEKNGFAHADAVSSAEADDDSSEEAEVVAPKQRGRKAKAQTKLTTQDRTQERIQERTQARTKAMSKAVSKANGTPSANGANGLHTRLQARLRNATFRETAREERETASARQIKATVGKALLLDLDTALKPRSKRAVQSAEAMEEQLRLIALRLGTQRVREILDEMEELAARA